ncbi:transposase, partial [Thiolapillus sp.]|uniref:transposase n=1 Tax=Thiolapillus sp. TaxID=2017437 RepID=UPI0025D2651F
MKAKGYEPVLTKSRWLLLKRPEHLTDAQESRLAELLQCKRPRIHTCFPDLTPCRLSPEISRHRRNRWTCLMPPKARH